MPAVLLTETWSSRPRPIRQGPKTKAKAKNLAFEAKAKGLILKAKAKV